MEISKIGFSRRGKRDIKWSERSSERSRFGERILRSGESGRGRAGTRVTGLVKPSFPGSGDPQNHHPLSLPL